MSYIDVFLAPVPKANKAAYQERAGQMSAIFKEVGALSIVECWGDEIPEGKLNSFHTAVLLKPDEQVVMGWIQWPSKEFRNSAMPKAMADPRMREGHMPFDGTRLVFGGFEKLFEV